MNIFYYVLLSLLAVVFLCGLRIVKAYENTVVFRLSKFARVLRPGLRWILIGIEKIEQRVDTRTLAIDVPRQECISRDNISVLINAVLYFKVVNAADAVVKVYDYKRTISQLAQTSMRNIVGSFELDTLLTERQRVAQQIKEVIDKTAAEWGIEVVSIEMKDIQFPETMKRAMAAQAEAERDKRARVTLAEGESKAADMLEEAGRKLAKSPVAAQLRFYETLSEIAAEKNSTIVLTVPVEILEAFKKFATSK